MSRQMPLIIIALVFVTILLGDSIPIRIAKNIFALSLTIKSAIIFILPVIIFSLLYKASVSLSRNTSAIVIITLCIVISSNFTVTMLAQFIGHVIYTLNIPITAPQSNSFLYARSFINFPNLIPNHIAMILGVVLGVISTKIIPDQSLYFAKFLDSLVKRILEAITFVIPVFIIGFVMKLNFDGIIKEIIKNYTSIFFIVSLIQYIYVVFLYAVLSKFKINQLIDSIKNMLPAALSGFTTMSSAASMPLILIGTEKNMKCKSIIGTVVPVITNIHLIGDCIAIPCFAFAILKNFNMVQPGIIAYFIFSIYFVIAKFSVAAVPGGGIIVMLPILEQYLGFSSDMLSLITALYILFDPITTSVNILGNGALAKIIDCIIIPCLTKIKVLKASTSD